MLLARDEPPPVPVLFVQPGSEGEAMSYVSSFGEGWEETPGALGWLHERAPLRPGRKKKNRKKARRGRKR